jgi:hypothetical protein
LQWEAVVVVVVIIPALAEAQEVFRPMIQSYQV